MVGQRMRFSAPWAPETGTVETIRRTIEDRIAEAWSLLESLVNVDSSPDHANGLERVVRLVEPAFAALGMECELERSANGLPVLHARRPAQPDLERSTRVLLIGHLDTVFPAGTVAEWPMHRDEDRAFGPGVADAKGGVVAMWLALASALEAGGGLPGTALHVILNTDEEAGSVESRPIFEREAAGADVALIYEPGRPDGSIVRQRRGARRYRITVRGRAAHTGVEPWNGVNAIEAAAHKVLALQALNDRDRFLSVTVAVIKGGERVNIVPDRAVIDVDTRLPDTETAEATHVAVEAIVDRSDVPGSSAAYEIISDRPPMMPQVGVPELLDRFRTAARAIGVELDDTATGGGSDGCFLSPLGVPTIDALGPVGGGYHTRDEFLNAPSLRERAMLSALVLTSFATAASEMR